MSETITAKRLERRRDGRVIAGVCGGVADYFGLDPVLIRIAAVALVLFGGSGLLLYAAAWLLMPEAGAADSAGERLIHARNWGRIAGIVLIALAAVSLAAPFRGFWHFGGHIVG